MNLSERAAAGKAARLQAPRSAHAAWEPPPDRADPVEMLEAQAQTRVPELVPIRYGRMLVSPFTFFRGAAAVMAADLATTPRHGPAGAALRRRPSLELRRSSPRPTGGSSSTSTTSTRRFRGRGSGTSSASPRASRSPAATAASTASERAVDLRMRCGSYREAMRGFAAMRDLEVWYARLDVDAPAGEPDGRAQARRRDKAVKRAERNVAKARSKDNMRAFDKLTHEVDGELRIISDPPLIVPIEELFPRGRPATCSRSMTDLSTPTAPRCRVTASSCSTSYRFVDLARKVVGVGSVGTRAPGSLLFMGADDDDPLFLQVKEAEARCWSLRRARAASPTTGERVVEGQRLMQAASDIFLGWCPAVGFDGRDRDFYVRQLWDWKGSADVEAMNPVAMGVYAQMCGWTLARAHARSGDRIAIAGYLAPAGGLRRGDRRVLRALRRPERARLRRARGGDRFRPPRRGERLNVGRAKAGAAAGAGLVLLTLAAGQFVMTLDSLGDERRRSRPSPRTSARPSPGSRPRSRSTRW